MAVVHLSLFKAHKATPSLIATAALTFLLGISSIGSLTPAALAQASEINLTPVAAKAIPLDSAHSRSYLAEIELNTPEELELALTQAKKASDNEKLSKPIAFILHGSEVYSLLKPPYRNNKPLSDLAQKLTNDGVIHIQVCRGWLKHQNIPLSALPDFVDTVDYAPVEINRLIQDEGYVYF